MKVIHVLRKPLTGTVAANVLAHGTGVLNIDATRIGSDGGTRREGKAFMPTVAGWANMRGHSIASLPAGRWPANFILQAGDDPNHCPVVALDEQSGLQKSVIRKPSGKDTRGIPNGTNMVLRRIDDKEKGFDDTGGASRYFKIIYGDSK